LPRPDDLDALIYTMACRRQNMKTSLRGLAVFILLFAAGALWASEPIRIGVLAYPPKPWQPLAAELKRQIPERDFIIEVLDHGALEQAVASRRRRLRADQPRSLSVDETAQRSFVPAGDADEQ